MNQDQEHNKAIQAVFASTEIPCPAGTPLAGYAGCRKCTGNHDPLLIQAAVLLDKKNQPFVFVNLDLLAVDSLIENRVKARLEKQHFEYRTLILQAIHTHCAPAGLLQTDQGFLEAAQYFAGKPDPKLADETADRIVSCILEAKKNASPASFRKAAGTVSGFASNRVEGKVIESRIFVLEATNETAKACFVFAANHPTVLGMNTTQSSADYVLGLREKLQEAGFRQTFFCNGPCGDVSCRYTRKASDFEEARRLGCLLGDGVLKTLEKARPISLSLTPLTTLNVPLPACRIPDPLEAQSALEAAIKEYEQAAAQGADALHLRELHVSIETAQVMVQKAKIKLPSDVIWIHSLIWKWEDEIFITYPGELFSTLPFLRDPHVHVLCYANGYNLYLADESAFEHQVYEALCSPFSQRAADVYNEAIKLCLKNEEAAA